jgi:hypothetical protein
VKDQGGGRGIGGDSGGEGVAGVVSCGVGGSANDGGGVAGVVRAGVGGSTSG